ncbi:TOX high mobility group box family member 4-A, putative isoform 1 [Cinnamomum micranthum f. kanehirae]|uniref:TOX high mobility group box family member 4-A, putative isoform 1 n=1 Tax=Cinnamomum micranthum f. kanehirae TaxID=337451 RepID=A0A443P5K0_9MAGN|nr:TOX high mobility group box family member 4-A, putative isoform 1 [Cinnamomum micranthum f. kanehirae]
MEGMASVCSYQQRIEELKHTLLCTSLELESAQIAAQEEKRRNDENVKQLLLHLKMAFQERDQAKGQLQMLLNNIMKLSPVVPDLLTESPPMIPSKGNSSITESDSLSDNYNRPSFVSSPVDSLFDAVNSPDLSNINMAISSNMGAPNQPFLQDFKASSSNVISSGMTQFDPASVVIDRLVMKKPLPEKGKLLKAVVDAGPLLQTLLVAGPLPQWRNPPPLQSLQIPPVCINEGGDSVGFMCPNQEAHPSFCQISNGASRVCSTSMLNFSNTSDSCLMKRPALSNGVSDGFAINTSLMAKRQKFQC